MIKEFVLAWEKNKDKLEEFIKTHKQWDYSEYKDLVRLLFEIVINPELESYKKYDTQNILLIDDGGYQGTFVFVLHNNVYQPSVYDYVYTNTN